MSTAPHGWKAPKTVWVSPPDNPTTADFERIEGNILAIEDGARTVDDSKVPTGDTGSLRELLDWIVNRIKAITGESDWYANPAGTIKGLVEGQGGATPEEIRSNGTLPLVIEVRTSDPVNPEPGRIWLRADLL